MADAPLEMRLALQYPNGRIHEVPFERDEPLTPGEKFEMYGRRWLAIGRVSARTGRPTRWRPTDLPMLCRPWNG